MKRRERREALRNWELGALLLCASFLMSIAADAAYDALRFMLPLWFLVSVPLSLAFIFILYVAYEIDDFGLSDDRKTLPQKITAFLKRSVNEIER
jgi:heme/copper-type cytochrome/quinol oxidase subunit 3